MAINILFFVCKMNLIIIDKINCFFYRICEILNWKNTKSTDNLIVCDFIVPHLLDFWKYKISLRF